MSKRQLSDDEVWRHDDGQVYHTDPFCHHVDDDIPTMRRAIAESWDTMSECAICKDGYPTPDNAEAATCSECGEEKQTPVASPDKRLCGPCLRNKDDVLDYPDG
jgi:hypothetical protein